MLILDDAYSAETTALAEALAAELPPMQQAVLQQIIDGVDRDASREARAHAEAQRAAFLAHLAQVPDVLWAHINGAPGCPAYQATP